MINELVPQLVEKYINEHREKLIIDIETNVNGRYAAQGKIADAIREDIISM